jgi:hypothetical protein
LLAVVAEVAQVAAEEEQLAVVVVEEGAAVWSAVPVKIRCSWVRSLGSVR